MKKIKEQKDKAARDASGNRFKIKKKENTEEIKIREKRSYRLKQALANLRLMIQTGLQTDPDVRKQQFFGGDHKKELKHHQHLEEVKEQFKKLKYNLSKDQDSRLHAQKVQRLLAMVRKGENNAKIDDLVRELDEHFITQLTSSTQKINFVNTGNARELEL